MINLFRLSSVVRFALWAVVLLACIFPTVSEGAQSFTVEGYRLVSSVRINRTDFEYTYQANVVNIGGNVRNLRAHLVSSSPNTIVVDNSLSFGDVYGGSTKPSSDTFKIRQNRSAQFDASVLQWSFQFDEATEVQPVLGNNNIISLSTVGAAGGTIEVTDADSPLYGTRVEFPAGALAGGNAVSIGVNPGTLFPNSGVFSGVILSLNLSQEKTFSLPVRISVRFAGDPELVPVPYYIDDNGRLNPVQLVEIDREGGYFVFETFHASLFTWIYEHTIGIPVAQAPAIIDTTYRPGNDGFQISNTGSQFNRGGECFGMTSFSLWYYMNKKSSSGEFFGKYYNFVNGSTSIRGQNVIATRAFISIAQQWNTYYNNIVSREIGLSDKEQYATIKNSISNTLRPVLIYLYGHSSSTATHSVLAYSIKETSNSTIAIYDPNYPNTTREITFDISSMEFQPYSGYSGVVFNGDGSLRLNEPYQNILDDADANFQGSTGATITISSHTSGQQVYSTNVTLVGKVDSGQVLATRIRVFVGSNQFTYDLNHDGSFSIPINLQSGINHLQFVIDGKDSNGNITLLDMPNNLKAAGYTLDAIINSSKILVTVTWDKDDTDVDTYVIDPRGDYSSYYHMFTADGGELDRDITTGFGPEHWTLETRDTIRYFEPYSIRLHYYSDHGHGSVNYTVSVKLYEGTTREVTYWYTGNLGQSNPYNYRQSDVGPDWVDVATITLTP